MSRLLSDLSPRFRPTVVEFLARCTEALVPVLIVTTGRTIEEQKDAVLRKVSWTMNSLHLPQPPDMKSLAIDVCPYDIYTSAPGGDKLLWDVQHPLWLRIGLIGESLGMTWGGRWKQKDMGHFQYNPPVLSGKDGFVA